MSQPRPLPQRKGPTVTHELEPSDRPLSRRSIVAAAWSLPAVAVAAAAPLASASGGLASLAWTDSTTGLLALRLLDGETVFTSQTPVTVPTAATFTNGPIALSGETAIVQISVGQPTQVFLPSAQARGFGVLAYNGVDAAGQSSVYYESVPLIGPHGFAITGWTGTQQLTVGANGSVVIPVEFGLAGVSSGATISVDVVFPVSIAITIGGELFTATTTITVTGGSGIL